MELTPAIRQRIFQAADTLYEQGGRRALPTVDAVRKHARVNMNDASVGMRAWRKVQTAQLDAPAVQVPATLQQSSTALFQALWIEALALTNETLKAAQARWDADRADLEAVSDQMANAYETQSAELAAANADADKAKQEVRYMQDEVTKTRILADEAVNEAQSARAAIAQAEARAIEIERRADDLRLALSQAHDSHMALVDEYLSRIQSQESEVAALRLEIARMQSKHEHTVSNTTGATKDASH